MSVNILQPREASCLVAETSKDVKVKQDGVLKVAKVMADAIKIGKYSIKSWKEHEVNPKTMDKAALDWIFVADTLNFSFWSADEKKKFAVTYKGHTYTGYWSLCAAMNRAIDEGIPLTDPNYFATITREDLQNILRSDNEYEMPLIDERLDVLHDAGKTLLKKYDGSFVNVVLQCDKSAQKLLQLVVQEFPSYRDETDYNGKCIAFYKRAQILIGDIWACFEGQGYGEFDDIDTITMFADYRIPQALVYFGAMEYTEELMKYLQKDHLLNSGIPLTDPNYFATITREDLRNILRSDNEYEMPLIDERLDVLHDAGKTLLKKYDGSFVNVVLQCDKSAQKLLQLVVQEFPSYRDETDYNGKRIAFYKRAQILIGDIWACFEGQGYGEFDDIDTITMFADYRIPQALVYFGAMEYTEKLMKYLQKDHLLNSGDRYEVEIRGCSIWATELISEETKKILAADQSTEDLTVNSIIIDHYLWDYRRDHADQMNVPFHRIRCIYY